MQSVPITTKAVRPNSAHGKVYLIQHYVKIEVVIQKLLRKSKVEIMNITYSSRNHTRRLEGEYDADISLSLKSSIVHYRSITTKATIVVDL
jgi:hypothetical protein